MEANSPILMRFSHSLHCFVSADHSIFEVNNISDLTRVSFAATLLLKQDFFVFLRGVSSWFHRSYSAVNFGEGTVFTLLKIRIVVMDFQVDGSLTVNIAINSRPKLTQVLSIYDVTPLSHRQDEVTNC